MVSAQVFQPGTVSRRQSGKAVSNKRCKHRVSTPTPPGGCLDPLAELPVFGLGGRWRSGYVLQHPPIAPPATSLEAQAIRGGKDLRRAHLVEGYGVSSALVLAVRRPAFVLPPDKTTS